HLACCQWLRDRVLRVTWMARRPSGQHVSALGALAGALATIVIALLDFIVIALSFIAVAAVFEGVILVVTTSRITPMSATMTKDPRTDTQSPAQHVADSQDLIRVQGARVINLKDVSVKIPKDHAATH